MSLVLVKKRRAQKSTRVRSSAASEVHKGQPPRSASPPQCRDLRGNAIGRRCLGVAAAVRTPCAVNSLHQELANSASSAPFPLIPMLIPIPRASIPRSPAQQQYLTAKSSNVKKRQVNKTLSEILKRLNEKNIKSIRKQ